MRSYQGAWLGGGEGGEGGGACGAKEEKGRSGGLVGAGAGTAKGTYKLLP